MGYPMIRHSRVLTHGSDSQVSAHICSHERASEVVRIELPGDIKLKIASPMTVSPLMMDQRPRIEQTPPAAAKRRSRPVAFLEDEATAVTAVFDSVQPLTP